MFYHKIDFKVLMFDYLSTKLILYFSIIVLE